MVCPKCNGERMVEVSKGSAEYKAGQDPDRCTTIPCPTCGGTGLIPDKRYGAYMCPHGNLWEDCNICKG